MSDLYGEYRKWIQTQIELSSGPEGVEELLNRFEVLDVEGISRTCLELADGCMASLREDVIGKGIYPESDFFENILYHCLMRSHMVAMLAGSHLGRKNLL